VQEERPVKRALLDRSLAPVAQARVVRVPAVPVRAGWLQLAAAALAAAQRSTRWPRMSS
jgi:hypothetical protein